MLDWLVGWLPLVFLFSIFGTALHFTRALLLGPRVELHSVALARERELRLARNRARRLRTVRYQDEHSSWDKDFALLGGGCACGHEYIRPRLRESPPLARW